MNRLLTTRNCSALIVLAGLLVYAWHIKNGFLDLDDQTFIFKNPLVLHGSFLAPFSQFSNLLYIPFTVISWQLTNAVFGMNPWAFHSIDLAIHCANAVLVFLLLERLTQHRLASFLAALVFVIHPLNAEAVYWASQRKDLLSAMFSLLSIHAYVRYLERDQTNMLVWSTVACIAALFTKVGSFPLPLLFLVMDWATGRSWSWRWIIEKLPMLIASALFISIGTIGAQQFLGPVSEPQLFFLAVKGTLYQVSHFVFPWTQNAFLHQQSWPWGEEMYGIMFFAVCAVVLLFGWLFFKRKMQPLLAIGIAWFCLFLGPTFTAAQKAGLMFFTSDKYGYVPMIGLLLICVLAFVTVTEKYQKLTKPIVLLVGVWVLVFGWRAYEYGKAWKDTVAMYSHVLAVDENNSLAHIGLGFIDSQNGEHDSALAHYAIARKNDPYNIVAYTNAAGVYRTLGKPDELAAVLREMIPFITAQQLKGDPSTVKVLLFAGREVLPSIDMELAREILTKLTEMVPENPDLQVLR